MTGSSVGERLTLTESEGGRQAKNRVNLKLLVEELSMVLSLIVIICIIKDKQCRYCTKILESANGQSGAAVSQNYSSITLLWFKLPPLSFPCMACFV